MAVHDFRDRQAPAGPKGSPAGRIVKGKLATRSADVIDAITLHQTATLLPPGKADLRAAKGDPVAARHLRALRVHAHVTAFTTGDAVIAYPLRAYVYHGNGLNKTSIGVECEAKLDGLAEKVDDAVVDATRQAFAWLCEHGPVEGIELRYVYAHRQASPTRRADPGLALWRAVVLDYAVPKLGLRTAPAKTWGKGRPVPLAWQPDGGVGRY